MAAFGLTFELAAGLVKEAAHVTSEAGRHLHGADGHLLVGDKVYRNLPLRRTIEQMSVELDQIGDQLLPLRMFEKLWPPG
jgi:hypothetical protein